jgi:hypothetical protein
LFDLQLINVLAAGFAICFLVHKTRQFLNLLGDVTSANLQGCIDCSRILSLRCIAMPADYLRSCLILRSKLKT